MTRIRFAGTTIVEVTGFCGIGFVNMPLRNTVVRELQRIEIFRKFLADAFGETINIDIAIVKRLHVIDFHLREVFFAHFFGFIYHGFRCTHRVLRIKREQNNFGNALFCQFPDAVFNAWFGVSHSDFNRNINQLLEFLLNFLGNDDQRRSFISPNRFISCCRLWRSCIEDDSLHQKRTKKPSVIDHFFIH